MKPELIIQHIDNIRNILSENRTEKNIDIFFQYFSLNGNQPVSMEEIGQSYGLTREAIRQSLNRTKKHLVDSKYIEKNIEFQKLLSEAFTIMYSNQGKESKIISLLNEQNILPAHYSANTLLSLLTIFDIPTNDLKIINLSSLNSDRLNKINFVITKDNFKELKKLYSKAIKMVSNKGFGTYEESNSIHEDLVSSFTDYLALQDNCFTLTNTGCNRMIKRIKHVFAYVSNVSTSRLLEGVNRSLRTTDHISLENFVIILKSQPFLSVDGSEVKLIDTNAIDLKPTATTEMESAVFKAILETEDNSLRERQLETMFIDEPKEKYLLTNVINFSPVIRKLERGKYSVISA